MDGRADQNVGPMGRPRGVLFVVLLSIVTFGIYWLYWVYKSHEEIKEHSGQGVGGVVGLVIGILLPVITVFVLPSEIGKMNEQDGRESSVSGWTGLWATLGALIIVGPIVWLVKVQRALNRYWQAKGGQGHVRDQAALEAS